MDTRPWEQQVTCRFCRERLAEAGNKHQDTRKLYDVGNVSRPEMGHLMYFYHAGRQALCVASPARR